MPSCAAQGCSARSDKGEVLKVFPRKDLRRRQIWIDRVNRPGWTPNRYSALCEQHFDRDQWELPREDGKRKLKSTAVPSIFCVEHPAKDDLVAKDHAYCILGYKKLFGGEYDYSDKEEESGILPIEHIKVEVDENENLAENVLVDEGNESGDDTKTREGVESIQCTPDIFMYPESSELDPIETVDCEENNINAFLSDPSNDPLAISSEDVELAGKIVPHFSHSTKYLFVTKDTKMVSNVPPVVEGEPVVTSQNLKHKALSPLCQKSSKSSILIPPPGSKVFVRKFSTSPPQLAAISKSSELKFPTQAESCPPKLTPIPKLLVPKGPLQVFVPEESSPLKLSPVSNAVQIPFPKGFSPPKLTPIAKRIGTSFTKLPSPPKPPKLTPISKSIRFLLPKGSSPPKLTPISRTSNVSPPKLKLLSPSGLSSPVKLKIVSWPLTQKDVVNVSKSSGSQPNCISVSATPNNVLVASKKKFVAQPMLQRAPEYLHSPLTADVKNGKNESTTWNYQFKNPLPQSNNQNKKLVSSSPKLYVNKAKRFHGIGMERDGQILNVDSMNGGEKVDPIFLEHQYTKKQPFDCSTLNGKQSKLNSTSGSRTSELLGSDHINVWLDHSNNAVSSVESNSTFLRNIGFKNKVPFTTGLVSKLKAGSLTKASSVVVLNPFRKSDSSISVCSSGKKLSQQQNLSLFECPMCKLEFLSSAYLKTHMSTHGDSMIISEEEEQGDEPYEGKNTKVIKRHKYSNGTRTYSLTIKSANTNKLKGEIDEDLSNIQRFGNDIVLIPNSKALKKFKDDEFIRLTKLVSTVNGNEDGISNDMTVLKRTSGKDNSGSNSDKCHAAMKSQDLKSKGSVIDESGRRYSLRRKTKSIKFKISSAKEVKNKSKNFAFSNIVKKNPVVLLSKMNLGNISKSKQIKNACISKCTEFSDEDESEGWKGWDNNADCHFNNDNITEISAEFGVKKASQSVSKKEDKNNAKDITKNKRPIRMRKSNLKESQNASLNEPSLKNSKLKCPTCTLLIRKGMFKSHILRHTKSEYSCKLCNKKFEKSFLLRRHVVQDHKVVKQFSCLRRDCSRKFESKRDLEKHMRLHKK